ncbi:response regulator [Vibrio ishigakensis]|nr:response regulator [Vibrio ishigakensis]
MKDIVNKVRGSLQLQYILLTVIALIGFAIDLTIPLGVAFGVYYVIVILVSLAFNNTSMTLFWAVTCSLLTVIGFLISPDGGEMWKVIFNRVISVGAILTVAIVSLLVLKKNKELMKLEADLELSSVRSRLGEVAEYAKDAIIITDKHGCVSWTNNAFTQITGYELADVEGKKPGDVLQGRDTEIDTVERLHNAVKNAQQIEVEILNYHKNGTPYWIELAITPILVDGELQRFIAVERDITTRKNLEFRLKELATMARAETDNKSHFMSLLIDELRVPLNRLKNINEKLRLDDSAENIQEVHAGINVCNSFIENTILSIETLENIDLNNFRIYKSSFRFNSIIENLRKSTTQIAGEQNLDLEFKDELSQSVTYYSDSSLINSIFSFYISSVANKLEDCKVLIHFSDSIQNDTGLVNLFIRIEDLGEVYHVLNDRVGHGNLDVSILSMGRSFVFQRLNEVIQKLGGSLDYGIENEDASTISLTLPLELDTSSFAPYPVETHQRILIAEDNRVNALVLIKMLRSLGFADIDTARNGAEAVEMARKKQYHAILMDNHMPIMNGIEASKIIKKTVDADINIIACTADSSDVAVEGFKQSGVDKIIFKPINKAKILEHLEVVDDSFKVVDKLA